ncbi:sugar kinase [Limnoraphis robusta]|uniref:Sugar kinase n=1 Tax=Limnoraphis robusta CCNP1315 TaxID=3110306 RepID=A0ABU5TWC6_9CYAN|nr:sugar kinase [Limnoraphis robusta]MEA5518961.1 sugar kinase [Limnoraphis robusta CCNP1315]MEA5544067.1 sugar kinase [Limnoraphis robusta CCNP1324]
MTHNGLFVGLVTLDFLYGVSEYPAKNQKVVASDYTVAAGGPATNGAVTFSYLKNKAKLFGVVGTHPITELIRADLSQHHVILTDLDPTRSSPPPVSSILVTPKTGDRTVVSINAVKSQATLESIPQNCLDGVDIVLIDGHQMTVSEQIAKLAREQEITVVMDGGSWKPGLEKVLPYVDYAICSANFYPPDCQKSADVFAYLNEIDIPFVARTQGDQPIQYCTPNRQGEIEIPPINAVDTLGAGDVFHGAFCHFILESSFVNALTASAEIAACSCQSFGTRQWMQ